MSAILHVLDHSLPEHDGYSFRSHSILRELDRLGLDISALTGPKQDPAVNSEETIDGIRYLRTPVAKDDNTSGVVGQLRTIRMTRASIAARLQQNPTDIIHAHSPCLNGIAAIGLGRPLVYEMRSSWEDAAVSVGTTHEGSLRYRLSRALETFVLKRADAVTVICDGLKTELVGRGIAEGKITVAPNALSEDMFVKPDAASVTKIRARYGLEGSRIIGFFGSFFEWEGVDNLVNALPVVLQAVPTAKLFIAGGGRQEAALHGLVADLGLESNVVFAGRVAHGDISACYAAADLMAYPRLPDRLTNMVTPLKPLEAMAQGTLVIASDVGGHRELISDGVTGVLFEAGSPEDLARKIVKALGEPDRAREITAQAAAYVEKEKRWSTVVDRYLPVYDRLMNRQRA
jgi:PEP-CTERM/exosortase A-associated glycosyltransferase